MPPVAANPFLGIFMHAIGALFAAVCYTPEKKVKSWSWQTYWLTQALFCWFLLPILGAYLTIPHILDVLREAPSSAMLNSFLLGAAYGIGGTAFGISIRYIGFSLTYAIAVGLSSVLGTLIPPLVHGTLGLTLSKPGAGWMIAGILIGTCGIAFTGLAGRLKEKDLEDGQGKGNFSLSKGLLLSLLAGVLSAVYGFALDAGEPIAQVASDHGAGIYRGNIIYIFANTGAFITTALYCLYLHRKHHTLGELLRLPQGKVQTQLLLNFGLAILTGCFWYGQFFFYNLGDVRMGHWRFSSWAIHMIMLVLFSNIVGVLLREWRQCRRLTHATISMALLVLIGAVLMLTVGNYIGNPPTTAAAPAPVQAAAQSQGQPAAQP